MHQKKVFEDVLLFWKEKQKKKDFFGTYLMLSMCVKK